MEKREDQRWIPCRVGPGMFSDERMVEVSGRSFFVDARNVRDSRDSDLGEVHVTVVDIDGEKWAIIPTSTRESIPLPA